MVRATAVSFCVCVYVCMSVCLYVCVCVYVCMYMFVCVCMYMYAFSSYFLRSSLLSFFSNFKIIQQA